MITYKNYRYAVESVDPVETPQPEPEDDGLLSSPSIGTCGKREALLRDRGVVIDNHEMRQAAVRMAVAIPSHYQEQTFYHGTPNEETAKKILESEELRPNDASQELMSPVEGRVYLTPSLEYVLSYILGAHPSCGPGMLCKRGGRYGYLFTVPGKNLVDIVPDEDFIGELIGKNKPSWLQNEFRQMTDMYWREFEHLSRQAFEALFEVAVEDAEECDEEPPDKETMWIKYDFIEHLADGAYPEVAEGGKFFLEHVDEDTLIELLEELHDEAVSHDGPVAFSECWRFDKKRVRELAKDGSNFFEIAERCE